MTKCQEQVKSNIFRPNMDRDRYPIEGFNGIPAKGIAEILKNAGPRLQFQFNDINNKCIGESWVLKVEKPIIDSSDLNQLKYIPITENIESLVIPDSAVSILIFGQQGRFASLESALDRLADRRKFQDTYIPTRGIEISNELYLITPMKLILGAYNLQNGEPTLKGYHDIIDFIEFENGRFKSLTTNESLFKINGFNHPSYE